MGVTDVGAFHELYPGCPEEQLAHRYTPNLDRLAEQGIRCTRAYAAAWCAPSRQMLLSGQWVNRRNAYDHPWIGSQLRQEGYVTGLVGKSHGGRPIAKTYRNMDPKTAEFDDGFFFNGGCRRSYLEKGETFPGRRGLVPFTFTAKGGEYLTDVYNDHAVEFIERNASRPFMLYLPYNAPHGPLDGKPEDLRKLFPEVFAEASDEDIISGPLMAPEKRAGPDQQAGRHALCRDGLPHGPRHRADHEDAGGEGNHREHPDHLYQRQRAHLRLRRVAGGEPSLHRPQEPRCSMAAFAFHSLPGRRSSRSRSNPARSTTASSHWQTSRRP